MSEKEQTPVQALEQTPEELKKKKRKKIIIAVCILLAIIVAVIIYFLTRPKEMNEGNYKQIMEEMEEQVQDGYFETYMNTEWTFPDGASETTNAILGNSPNNKKPIRCEVILADTEEVVFTTDVIPVGAELPPFKLDVDLDAGTYDAVCRVYLLNEEDDGTYTDYSNAGFNITITVEN
ncbi:MAG: hypothetical protein HFH12_10145 [Dorea sp.]|nr:hypothetical protein [Dorea sp.]